MRIALISDIHANWNALQAVLEDIDRQKPDLVFSLGDQVGMGPKPVEVIDALRAREIPCLLGNHEMRVLALRAGTDAAYLEDVNYAFARWNRAALQGISLDDPMERLVQTPAGGLMLRHAGGDNPFLRVRPEEPEPLVAELAQTDASALAIGHLHDTFTLSALGKILVVTGAVSTAETGVPGVAQYMMVHATDCGFVFCPHCAAYDLEPLWAQFIDSGLVDCDPIMARLVHEALRMGRDRVSVFVGQALEAAGRQGRQRISLSDWTETARAYPWMEPALDCEAYWK